MTIAIYLAPTQCKLIRICLEFDDGVLVRSDAEVDIFNADGSKLLRHTIDIPWTIGERTAIEANIIDKYTLFKSANELTEYVEPEEVLLSS